MRHKVAFVFLVFLMILIYFSYDRLTRPYFFQDLHHVMHKTVSRVSESMATGVLGKPKAKPLCYADEKKLTHLINNPHDWVVKAISQGFTRYDNVSVERVRDTFAASLPGDSLVLYQIKDGVVSIQLRNLKMNGACVYAANYYQRLFADLATRMGIKNLTFLLRLGDLSQTKYASKMRTDVAPILAVTSDVRHPVDGRAILIPDYQNLLSWPRMMKKIAHANQKWPGRQRKRLFFGAGGLQM